MRHVHAISCIPKAAQTVNVCTNIGSDFQARLCFLFQILTQFFLPLADLKNTSTEDTTS